MSDGGLSALKHALMGASVGTVAAMAGDFAYSQIIKVLAPVAGNSASKADEIGKAAVAIVVSSGSAAFAFYAGDLLMNQLGGIEDPLQGIFFYHTCWNSMGATMVTPRILRNLLNSAFTPSSTPAPAPPVDTKQESKGKSCSGGKMRCGALDL